MHSIAVKKGALIYVPSLRGTPEQEISRNVSTLETQCGRPGERSERDRQIRQNCRDRGRDGDGQECVRAWLGVMQCEGHSRGNANGSPRQLRAKRSRLVKSLASLSEISGGSLGGEFWTIGVM